MTRFLLVASILLAAGGVANAASPVPIEAPKLSGPHTVDNLTLFFIHGPDTLKGDYLTLQEAMRDKKVIVHETENVNELAVENVSDKAVYIQSGEIVKGGKQDCRSTRSASSTAAGRGAAASRLRSSPPAPEPSLARR
jgi:hypothetical protein